MTKKAGGIINRIINDIFLLRSTITWHVTRNSYVTIENNGHPLELLGGTRCQHEWKSSLMDRMVMDVPGYKMNGSVYNHPDEIT